MIRAVAGRELKSLFLSPLAWTILAVLQGITAWIFLIQLDRFLSLQPQLAHTEGAPGATDIIVVPLFNLLGILLLMVMPLLTMLCSGERKSRAIMGLYHMSMSLESQLAVQAMLAAWTGTLFQRSLRNHLKIGCGSCRLCPHNQSDTESLR